MSQLVKFTVTEDHLKLLRRMWVTWEDCEYGAPAIDCKRPYGNSSVDLDIAEILGWPIDEEDGLTDEQRSAAALIHEQTQYALQIALGTGIFETGTYETGPYHRDWKKVQNETKI